MPRRITGRFVGPWDRAPKEGDKKTYQMDFGNVREAVRELILDEEEGADMVMVKPAGAYLDVIAAIRSRRRTIPVSAYQVSGEYLMIKSAAAAGWLDEQAVMMESLTAIKRAGADFILTYFAKEVARGIGLIFSILGSGTCYVGGMLYDGRMIQRIVTHPGSAHKDEFIACCVLLPTYSVPIERREPTETDLVDASVCVVDVGGEWEAGRMNFDHHQFPRESDPQCAISLVLKHLDVYEDAREFCDWLETAEWFDTRGAVETGKWLGVEREVISRLNSPVDVSLLRRFAQSQQLSPGDALWEVMKMVGEDLMEYLQTMRERLDYIQKYAHFWTLDSGAQVLYMPRTEPLGSDSSMGLGRFIDHYAEKEKVVGMVYPDRRGSGYGMSRYQDDKRMEFTRINGEADVHFAHARGFVAKTSATDEARLRELLEKVWVG